MARWLTPDPIGFSGGLNLYAYVDNQPVGAVDPSGLIPQTQADECRGTNPTAGMDPAGAIFTAGVVATLFAGVGIAGGTLAAVRGGGLWYGLGAAGVTQGPAALELGLGLAGVEGATGLPGYFIQSGVRRSVAAREAGKSTIRGRIHCPGQSSLPPIQDIPVGQLHAPEGKAQIPYDRRWHETLWKTLQGEKAPAISVEPLGVPGQGPSIPLGRVQIVRPDGPNP